MTCTVLMDGARNKRYPWTPWKMFISIFCFRVVNPTKFTTWYLAQLLQSILTSTYRNYRDSFLQFVLQIIVRSVKKPMLHYIYTLRRIILRRSSVGLRRRLHLPTFNVYWPMTHKFGTRPFTRHHWLEQLQKQATRFILTIVMCIHTPTGSIAVTNPPTVFRDLH